MSKWIKCSERLPEVGEWVLVFTPVKGQSLIELALLDITIGFINPLMRQAMKNVTHWQPLPEPPSEVDDMIESMNREMMEKLAKNFMGKPQNDV